MGSDVAYKVLPPSLPPQSLTHLTYKLSTSWEERYTSLRRVRAKDFEDIDSSVPGVHDLFPLGKFIYITHSLTHALTHQRLLAVKYDAYERYLYISNIIDLIGKNWSPLIAFIIISSMGGMGLVYG